MVTINASYPESMNHFTTDRMLKNVAQKYQGRDTGSGFGFGWRDIDFEFPSEKQADAFVADIAENPETQHKIRLTDG